MSRYKSYHTEERTPEEPSHFRKAKTIWLTIPQCMINMILVKQFGKGVQCKRFVLSHFTESIPCDGEEPNNI